VYASGNTVYAATTGGLSISTDGGSTWTNKTQANTSNGLGSNAVNGVYASGNTVYAATTGGLSISTDGGSTWTNKTQANTSNGLGNNDVRGVYASGGTVYAATAGGGLGISTDGGATWTTKTITDGLVYNFVNGVYASDSTVYAVYGGGGGGLSIATVSAGTGAVTGSAAFTDPAGRTLSYSAPVTSAGGGTVSLNASTGAFTYAPTLVQRRAAIGSTTDTFTITASNGVNSNAQTVTVSVLVDAGIPVAGSATSGSPANADGAVSGSVSFTDPTERTLSYSAPANSTGGGTVSVNASTGAFTFTPTQAQRQAATGSTTDTFTITATNGVNSTAQTVTVSVNAGTPVAGSATSGNPANADGAVSGSAAFTDPAGRTLSYSTTGTSTGGGTVSVDASTGAFTYTPTQAQRQAVTGSTTDTFTITASNGVNSATKTVTVSVDAGIPVAGSATSGNPADADGAVSGSAAFTDPAGRTLSYSAPVTSNGGGTVSVDSTTGAYTFTPTQVQRQAATGSTTDTFTITASNGVNENSQTVTVAVDPGTPIAGTPTVGTPDSSTGVVIGSAAFTDTAGRALTYTTSATSTGGATVSIDATTGVFVYTPTEAQLQAASVGWDTTDTFTVSTANGVNTATQTVTVAADPANYLRALAYAQWRGTLVTTTNDYGSGSLRQAITNANMVSRDDLIMFSPSLFTNGVNRITLGSEALPTIDSTFHAGRLTITGPGAFSLIISGNNGNANRNFSIFNIASGGHLSISGVTVSGAQLNNYSMYNFGHGGGFNNLGTLSVADCAISNNTADWGGGIYSAGRLTVVNSTFTGNSSLGGYGGGLFIDARQYAGPNPAVATVVNSTFSANSSHWDGGGIYNIATLTLISSTLSGNSAADGGGISNYGTLIIRDTIIANNTINNYGGVPPT
jgi:hypothetical protein